MKFIRQKNETPGRFGSFAGVFVPNALTILGLILFMRTGWTVGQAGLWGALLIIVIAGTISLLTGFSLSAIATNMRVKTGGAYFMISRSLGLEIGGAIGIPLFLSQATSVAFYIIGFSEALTRTFPAVPYQSVSAALVLFFGLLAYLGAHFVIRLQYIILAVLALALLSFFSGSGPITSTVGQDPGLLASQNFWDVFAVFFPAVTGIMVGVSMSGDLKNPGSDIPRGTLSAVVVTTLIYLAVALWLDRHADQASLRTDPMIMQKIARWPFLILAGIWASTLSSALGSAMAAPRTLQALSMDGILPRFMGHQLGSPTEPRMAVLVTTLLALVVIFLGQLNFVAKLITMFFLNTYGMINITAGMENLIGNPSFRPRLKVPGWVCIVGGLGCYAAMLLIHPPATGIAVLLSYGIYFLLKRRSLRQRWGDLRSGVWMSLARASVLRLLHQPLQPKNWRPNIVVFTGAPGTSQGHEHLMELAVWLAQGGGIVTLNHLLIGSPDELAGKGYRQTSETQMQRYLDEHGAPALCACTIVGDFAQGVTQIAQVQGFRGINANTVMLGWPHQVHIQENHLRLTNSLLRLKKSVLFLYFNPLRGFGQRRRIDVWWRGRDRNVQLMLMLAHIIQQDQAWNDAEIRLIRVLSKAQGVSRTESFLKAFLKQIRVQATPVILTTDEQPYTGFKDSLAQHSNDTDLILLGLSVPRMDQVRTQSLALRTLLHPLPSTLLVRSAEIEDILTSDEDEH